MSKPKYVTRKINDLKDMLEQTVALHSDREAFIKKTKEGYVSVTYKKYKEDIFGLGTELLRLNVKGENVILLSENRYEWCISFMATVCCEGTIVPVDSEITENNIVSRINNVKGKLIIFSEKYRSLVRNIRKKCPTLEYAIDMDTIIDDSENLSLLRLIELGNRAILNGENDFTKQEINREAVAGIFYGNTIVKNKGVMLSHKNLATVIMGIASLLPIEHEDKTSVFLHLSEMFQCVCSFLVMNSQGASISFAEKDKNIWENLKESEPSIIFLSNELLNRIYNNIWISLGSMPNVRRVKILMLASMILIKFNIDLREKIFKDVLKNFGRNFKLMVVLDKEIKNKILRDLYTFGINTVKCYNLLEASSVIMVNNKKESVKENIIGLPLPGLKACIFSSNNRAIGEITLKGDTVMKGYYEDKKATKKVVQDGILYTGKTGYRDRNGYFYYDK